MYNGTTWTAMPTAAGAAAIDTVNVDSLASDGTNVFVGTDDVDIAGIPQADHVARWDGAAWSAVGSNTAGTDGYFPLATAINGLFFEPGTGLFATGNFANANGDPLADQIAFFGLTGAWDHLGSSADGTNGPFIQQGHALAFFNGEPVVGGAFTDAGGDLNADRIASFPASGPTLPPPVQGAAVNLSPVSGTVTVDLKNDSAGFIPLRRPPRCRSARRSTRPRVASR